MYPIHDDVLRSITPPINETRVGWIDPDGKIIRCELYGHRDVLPQKYHERYDELLNLYNESTEFQLSNLEEDEHPQMHRFNNEADAESDLMVELSADHYIRFGIYHCRDGSLLLDLDANDASIKKHRHVISYLANAMMIGHVHSRQKRLPEFEFK